MFECIYQNLDGPQKRNIITCWIKFLLEMANGASLIAEAPVTGSETLPRRAGGVGCVCLVFRKAFDRLPHRRVNWKLKCWGGMKGTPLTGVEIFQTRDRFVQGCKENIQVGKKQLADLIKDRYWHL